MTKHEIRFPGIHLRDQADEFVARIVDVSNRIGLQGLRITGTAKWIDNAHGEYVFEIYSEPAAFVELWGDEDPEE